MISKPTFLLIIMLQFLWPKQTDDMSQIIGELVITVIAIFFGGCVKIAKRYEKKQLQKNQGIIFMVYAVVAGAIAEYVLLAYWPNTQRPLFVFVAAFCGEWIIGEMDRNGEKTIKGFFDTFIKGVKKNIFKWASNDKDNDIPTPKE
jgi:hypothetical protein